MSFADPLHFIDSPTAANLPTTVEFWESRDPHYDIEAGYYCHTHKHSVAGPLED